MWCGWPKLGCANAGPRRCKHPCVTCVQSTSVCPWCRWLRCQVPSFFSPGLAYQTGTAAACPAPVAMLAEAFQGKTLRGQNPCMPAPYLPGLFRQATLVPGIDALSRAYSQGFPGQSAARSAAFRSKPGVPQCSTGLRLETWRPGRWRTGCPAEPWRGGHVHGEQLPHPGFATLFGHLANFLRPNSLPAVCPRLNLNS